MNKYQEALDYINGEAIQEITNSYFRKHKTLDGISFEEFDKNLTKIQGLVDKATPKKPKRKLIETEDLWNEEITIVGIDICDDCKNQVQHSEKFCKHCGQALDWSKDDNPHRQV